MKKDLVIKFLFCMFCILGTISMIWSNLYNQNEIKIPLLGHINADIRVNIETNEKNIDKITLMSGDVKVPPYVMKTKNNYITYEINKVPIYNLNLKASMDAIDEIKSVVIFVSDKMSYFSKEDILKFKKTHDGRYIFPNDIKYSKTSSYITDKGPLKHLTFGILSVFYNVKFYIFPIACFAIAALIYLSNKEKINLGFKLFSSYAIWWILLFALCVRLCDASFSFWSDEIYTATVAGNPNLPFFATFQDPGNPPLFFIFARYWQAIFGQNEALLRVLPAIFSVLTILALYFFTKTFSNKKMAILCAFLCAINIYAIHSGREFRCYSLCTLFSVLCAFCFFKIKHTKENKYFILYSLVAILMANTHYFQILILLGNFILAMFLFDSKSKLKFFYSNSIAGILFLPYFLSTALNKAFLDKTFNALTCPTFKEMLNELSNIFASPFVLVSILAISIVLLVPKMKNLFFDFNEKEKQKSELFLYSIYSVLFLYISAYIFSLFRPIIRSYYFINCIPFVVILLALVLLLPYKNKVLSKIFLILFFVCYFSFGNYSNKDKTILVTFENIFKYAYFDSKKFPDKKIGVGIHDTESYRKFYDNYMAENEEILLYEYGDGKKGDIFCRFIMNNDADIVYARLDHDIFPYVSAHLMDVAEVSMIRSDKDVIIGRIVKRK